MVSGRAGATGRACSRLRTTNATLVNTLARPHFDDAAAMSQAVSLLRFRRAEVAQLAHFIGADFAETSHIPRRNAVHVYLDDAGARVADADHPARVEPV